MDISFKGKRALVTGAAQGIGRGIALKLAECGATVVALDCNKNSLDTLKQENSFIQILAVDLSNWNDTIAAVKTVYPIDLLVNNAGIGSVEPLTTLTEQKCDTLLNVNVKAVMNVTKIVVEDLLARKVPGAIVNISSKASKAALFQHTLYCATKGAVDAFTRAAALEFGPNNIRINSVNPTIVMTDLGKKFWGRPEVGDPVLAKIPIGRFAEVEDVVDAVVFLLSDKASMITGSCLAVDGGYLAC